MGQVNNAPATKAAQPSHVMMSPYTHQIQRWSQRLFRENRGCQNIMCGPASVLSG